MNRRNNNNRNRRNNYEAPKKIIRCNHSQRVVWDNECCNDFIVKDSSLNQEFCKNCKHSF
jgi:hypothetical protein